MLLGVYARRLYHPLSAPARGLHDFSRLIRGKATRSGAATRLEQVHWSAVFPSRAIRLTEVGRVNGNVRVNELALLALAAAHVQPPKEIVEIGTFDGRTTLNLAINAPRECRIFTLDLPPDQATRFTLDPGERRFVEKPAPGARYRECARQWRPAADRITQLLGDSATFDWTMHLGRAGLVFVDGSHSYEYARADSLTALRLLSPPGAIVWHDYGVWAGVTRALEELAATQALRLLHLRGTSLVVLRADPTRSCGSGAGGRPFAPRPSV